MKPWRAKGLWWLPDRPDRKVAGTLAYSPTTGLRLDVLGVLAENPEPPIPAVFGLMEGKKVTLTDVQFGGMRRLGLDDEGCTYAEQRWYPYDAFVGAFFRSPASATFREAVVGIAHLEEWLGLGDLWGHFDVGKDLEVLRRNPTVKGPQPTGEFATQLANASLSVRWDLRHSLGKQIRLSQEAYCVLKFCTPIPWATIWHEYVWPLRQFFTFAMGQSSPPSKIEMYQTAPEEGEHPLPVAVSAYHPVGHRGSGKDVSRHRMLFWLHDWTGDPGQLLRCWFDTYGRLREAINIRLKDTTNSYLEDQVLSATHAVEAYDRLRSGEQTIIDPAKHGVIRRELERLLPEDLPRDYRDRIRLQLKYANQPPLARRLRRILERLRGVLRPLDGAPDTFLDRLITNVTATRNYLTHYDPDDKEKALPEEDWFRLIRTMKLIFDCSLLQDLGFSNDAIRGLVGRNYTLKLVEDDMWYLMTHGHVANTPSSR